ncbi:unnamed protein product [Microthlaspi erraticum]|uniref:Uncharacterized protein n=1 Tax=Microthlaspi erraticum TaxID=1685480 RepID=A0A6D2HDQ7_9BRAS|nr:unnamed protein product [Microthlaspi erraticum]
MGREEHGRTWCMDAAQLDTQRKKEEAILKTSSTTRSSSSTRPAKFNSIELGSQSLLEHSGAYGTRGAWRTWTQLMDAARPALLDQPVEFLNSTGQASTRSS